MGNFLAQEIKKQTDSILRRMKNAPAAAVRGGTITPGTGPGTTPEIVEPNADLDAHKTSGDHDGRYYTETEIDVLLVNAGKYFEPVTNGDISNPEIVFFNGDVVMVEVA